MNISIKFLTHAILASTATVGLQAQPAASRKLIGCWHLITQKGQDAVEMEFKHNGELIYSIKSRDRWSIMKLTYRLDGNIIISNQPSPPHEERTKFRFETNGNLVLEFNGATSRYLHGPKCAPSA
jgi:uncharacterized protein (TIGR03066 family)